MLIEWQTEGLDISPNFVKIMAIVQRQFELVISDYLNDYKVIFERLNPNLKIVIKVSFLNKERFFGYIRDYILVNNEWVANSTYDLADIRGYWLHFEKATFFKDFEKFFEWKNGKCNQGFKKTPTLQIFDYLEYNVSDYLKLQNIAKFCKERVNWCEKSQKSYF